MSSFDSSDWVDKYTADLCSQAFYKVSDEELTRDLLQETFLAAAERKVILREKLTKSLVV